MDEIAEKIKVDTSGRIVLPSSIRKAAGIREGEMTALASRGEIILRPMLADTDAIAGWFRKMASFSAKARKRGRHVEKWYTKEYARRKLGL